MSQLGDAIVEVTLPVWVGLLTGSPQHVAGVAAAEAAAALLVGPLAGVWADRRPPRATMAASNLACAGLLLALLAAPRDATLPALYLVGFLVSCATAFFNPARGVALRLLLTPSEFAPAQARARATQSLALVLGPVLGAGLLLRFGPAVGLLVDALTFIAGALAILQMRPPVRHPTAEDAPDRSPATTPLADFRDGIALTLRDGRLVLLLIVAGVVHLIGNLWFAVDVFFVERSLGAPKESVGLLWTASGAGGLVGSALVVGWARHIRQSRILLAGLGLQGAALLWYASMTTYAWAVPAAFTSGAGGAAIAIASGSLLLRWAPPRATGRVTALFETTGQLLTVVAIAAVGLLDRVLTPAQVLLTCGLALCVVGAVAATYLRTVPPDA